MRRIAGVLVASLFISGSLRAEGSLGTGRDNPAATNLAWRDRASWPARFEREAGESTQGIIVELPAGRTTHVWRSLSSGFAVSIGVWNTKQDGELLVGTLPEGETPPSFSEVGPGGFGFVRSLRNDDEPFESLPPAAAMMFVTAREDEAGVAAENRRALTLERTWFSLYDPKAGPARGVAVLMPGLFGTPEAVFDQVVRHLQSRRWVVVRMMAQPSRYTESLEIEIDPANVGPMAARVAESFDQRAAECAYAVEAALAWAEAQRPEVRGLTRVIIGGSGGAMSLPPVAARMPGAFAAAVLIAGGADYATIAATSNYEDWVDSVHLRWEGRRGTDEEIRAFGEAYLNASMLDAYHTSESLHGVPMLVMQATRDKAVPAAQQELLWERLGKPERRLLPMGHETLFISLPLRMGGIMDWLDSTLESRDAKDAEVAPQPASADGTP